MKTTRDTLIKACYQYLLDHTIPTDKGPAVSFILVKESVFKKRVLGREQGFKRINKEEIIENAMEYREKLPFVKHAKRQIKKLEKNQWKQQAQRRMEKEGTLYEKLSLKLYYLLKERTDKMIIRYKK